MTDLRASLYYIQTRLVKRTIADALVSTNLKNNVMNNQFMMSLNPLTNQELDKIMGGKVTKTTKTTVISPDGTITTKEETVVIED